MFVCCMVLHVDEARFDSRIPSGVAVVVFVVVIASVVVAVVVVFATAEVVVGVVASNAAVQVSLESVASACCWYFLELRQCADVG